MQKLVEKTKQSLHVGERTFKPTPNLRNPAMLHEAEDFAVHMTQFRTNLKRYQAAVQVFLRSLPQVARGNLPRVWERVEGGLCEPLRPNVSHDHPTRVGGTYDDGLLRDARDILDAQVGHDVLRPIDRWLESLAVARTRMRKLEGLRLDVDARRRRVHRRYMRALARMERRGAPGGSGTMGVHGSEVGGPSRRARSAGPGHRRRAMTDDETSSVSSSSDEEEYELRYGPEGAGVEDVRAVRGQEDFIRSALYYQRKLDAVQSSYQEQEELVWQHLSGLVRDAAWLKAFVAGALLDIKEALQASAVALGPCKLPLPAFPRFNAGGEYGAIGDPSPLVADIPESLKSAAGGLLGGMTTPLALAGASPGGGGVGLSPADVAAALRPKRITAQPLQTSADLTTPRYGPVPPVVRGQPGVPADELAAAAAAPAALPPAGTGAGPATHGGGMLGAVKDLVSEVTAAARQGPIGTGPAGQQPIAAGGL
ncbi:hypothetical protein HYH03_006791 [Edaphochlamys debaryana]|uniref:Uncharacterized protein n=1 Tax=Edaphochlamys debaryana TaxID=47281 RepID=A0A835YA72_9CHLO|nr:hypothetical protein HYH03_006791 [Edaphochlamys debaryana]|eukprot:KAG2495185.1 hypothetical protein HYH03_006791 [Edaphochlamys debaryana]